MQWIFSMYQGTKNYRGWLQLRKISAVVRQEDMGILYTVALKNFSLMLGFAERWIHMSNRSEGLQTIISTCNLAIKGISVLIFLNWIDRHPRSPLSHTHKLNGNLGENQFLTWECDSVFQLGWAGPLLLDIESRSGTSPFPECVFMCAVLLQLSSAVLPCSFCLSVCTHTVSGPGHWQLLDKLVQLAHYWVQSPRGAWGVNWI